LGDVSDPPEGLIVTVEIALPPDLAARLRAEADRRGLSPDACAAQVLDQHLPPADPKAAADAWYEQWMAEAGAATPADEADAEAFFKALDEDRPSYRKLFPDELKGITW
jgi:hypothetical protein